MRVDGRYSRQLSTRLEAGGASKPHLSVLCASDVTNWRSWHVPYTSTSSSSVQQHSQHCHFNLVHFGPLTAKNRTVVLNHPRSIIVAIISLLSLVLRC